MSAIRAISISFLVIVAGFLVSQGLGTEFGIISQVDNFEDKFPEDKIKDCDWSSEGELYNINVTSNCRLEIEEYGVSSSNDNVTRVLIDSELEWNTLYQDRQNIKTSKESNKEYITTVQDYQKSSNISYYDTISFQSQSSSKLSVFYRYNLTSQADEAVLQLRNSTGIIEEKNLGSASQPINYEYKKVFQVPEDGEYYFRIKWDNGTFNQQKLLSLRAKQYSSNLTNFSSGRYTTGVKRGGVKQISVESASVESCCNSKEVSGTIKWKGYRAGSKVVEKTVKISEGNKLREDFASSQKITGYGFEVNLFSEKINESAKVEKVSVKGNEYSSNYDETTTQWLKTAVFMIMLAMALLFLGYALNPKK